MKARLLLIFLSLGVLAFLNWAIYDKEQILLAHGEAVYLQLAPRDPRTLIQGDYMRLRYAIEDDVAKEYNYLNLPPHGQIVVRMDSKGVAQYARLHKDEPLAAGEKLIRFREQGGGPDIKPDSFLFQEGHAKYYEQAKYGIFVFADPDTYLLTGLADENLKKITPP